MHLKTSSAKWQSICLCLNVLSKPSLSVLDSEICCKSCLSSIHYSRNHSFILHFSMDSVWWLLLFFLWCFMPISCANCTDLAASNDDCHMMWSKCKLRCNWPALSHDQYVYSTAWRIIELEWLGIIGLLAIIVIALLVLNIENSYGHGSFVTYRVLTHPTSLIHVLYIENSYGHGSFVTYRVLTHPTSLIPDLVMIYGNMDQWFH